MKINIAGQIDSHSSMWVGSNGADVKDPSEILMRDMEIRARAGENSLREK